MKKYMKLSMVALILMLGMGLTSCFVETDGPVGPRGADGWSDIKIITFNVNYDQWFRDDSETNYWYFTYNSNLIDYKVIDDGAVLFYYGYFERDGVVDKWYSIPFTNAYFDGSAGTYFQKIYDANYSPGKIEIEIRDTNPLRFDFPDDRDIQIKAVILEGDYYANLLRLGTDIKDLDALMRKVDLLNENIIK